MCGSRDLGEFPDQLLSAMNDSISHRGPDDAGAFFEP